MAPRARGSDGGKGRPPVAAKRRKSAKPKAAVVDQRKRDAVLGAGLAVKLSNPLVAAVPLEMRDRVAAELKRSPVYDTTTAEGRALFRKEAKRNFRFFCARVAVIRDKATSKLVKLSWNRAQRRLAETLVGQLLAGKPMMAVIAKARQWGCSTVLTALACWMMLTQDGYGVCLVIHEKRFLTDFREKYREILRGGCRVFGLSVVADNAETIRLSNGSRIDFYAAGTKNTSEQIRSNTYSFAHLTEIPYWYDVHKTMGAVTSVVDLVKGNGICLESTPRTRGDAFHQLFVAAKSGKIGYAPMFVPWHELEGYSVALTEREEDAVLRYLRGELSTSAAAVCERELGLLPDKDNRVGRFGLAPQQYVWWCRTFRDKALLNLNTMRTEYPDDDESCFLSSGKTVLDSDQLKRIGETVISQRLLWKRGLFEEGVWKERLGGWCEVLEVPEHGQQYVMAGDIAQGGDEGDFTCFGVAKRQGDRLTLVAGMYDRCNTFEAAERAKALWEWYGRPIFAPEANGPGVAFIMQCRKLAMHNIWLRRKLGQVGGGVEHALGVQTTATTKPAMIAALMEAARSGNLVCGWAPAYTDLAAFCWTDERQITAKAVKGAHDDAAMMLAILCWVAVLLPTQKHAQGEFEQDNKSDSLIDHAPQAHLKLVAQAAQPRTAPIRDAVPKRASPTSWLRNL